MSKPRRCRLASTAPGSMSPWMTTSRACWSPLNGGLVKITELGNAKATGTVLLPLESTAEAGPGTWQIVTYQHAGIEPPGERPRGRLARAPQREGVRRERVQLGVLHLGRQPRAGARRHPRRTVRLRPDLAGDARAVPSDRGGGRDLPRRVRAEEPADRADRGEHQQPGGGAVDRVRSARACGVPQFLRPAAFGSAGRWPGARLARAADDHHRVAGGARRRCRHRSRRLRSASAPPSSRRFSITSCRSPCLAS